MTHVFLISAAVVTLSTACLGCAHAANGIQSRDSQRPSAVRSTSAASERLQSHIEEYWKRRQAKDLAGAYAFYCTAYKARVPQAEFLQLTRLTRTDLRGVRVARIKQTGDRAEVWLSLRFMIPALSAEPGGQ